MSVEWILVIASIIVIWLVVKSLLKMVIISFNTAVQIFIILVILRVFFTIMPQEVLKKIQEMPQLIRDFLWIVL
ncbi:MAG: hypothetical protein BRC33_02410 [Cyanobacteria bacterium SW_9_44_58]|nr:MAG: hypothetical protein BRC33_02410 [Cyanobacteria bacterium SW_9_44_58]